MVPAVLMGGVFLEHFFPPEDGAFWLDSPAFWDEGGSESLPPNKDTITHLIFLCDQDVRSREFLGGPVGAALPAMRETQVWSLGQQDPLEKEMATHSSILAWRIQWTGEPGGLQSLGSQRVAHNWATNSFTFQWLGLLRARVWSLVGELRSCKLHCTAKIESTHTFKFHPHFVLWGISLTFFFKSSAFFSQHF